MNDGDQTRKEAFTPMADDHGSQNEDNHWTLDRDIAMS